MNFFSRKSQEKSICMAKSIAAIERDKKWMDLFFSY